MIPSENFFEKRIRIEEPKNQETKEPAEEKREPIRRESSSPPHQTPEEEILETREKVSSKPLAGREGRVIFISFKNDGDGVFKPVLEEYKKERAAYLVDRFLGFNFVPPTVIRTIDDRVGSIQQFVADTSFIFDMPAAEREKYKADLMKLWVFDYIIWNVDRNDCNFLSKDGRIYAIDHGYAFSNTRGRFYSYKEYFNELMSQEVIEKINKFLSWEDSIKILSDLLGELLPEADVRACIARIKKLGKLLEKGRIDSYDRLDFDPKIN